jgi:hypothetical protein
MAKKDQLFNLIQSLNKSEKGYVKKFATLNMKDGTSNYMQLFDAIDRQEIYDEAKLLRKFSEKAFTRQFARTKNYLFHFILKALRNFHTEKKPDFQVTDMIAVAQLLLDKQLNAEAQSQLTKAKKLATDLELFTQLIDILAIERPLIFVLSKREEVEEKFRLNLEEEAVILEKQKNVLEYKELNDRVFVLTANRGYIEKQEQEEELKVIMQSEALSDQANCLSFFAKLMYGFTWINYYTQLKDWKQCDASYGRLFELFEANPAIKEFRIKRFLILKYNYMAANIAFKNYDKVLEQVAELENYLAHNSGVSEDNTTMLLETCYHFEMAVFHLTLRFQDGLAKEEEILQEIKKRKFRARPLTTIYYTLTYFHFACGNYKKSQQYVNRHLLSDDADLEHQVATAARLLDIIAQFKEGDTIRLSYSIRNTLNFMKKHGGDSELIAQLIQLIQKLSEVKREKERVELLTSFRDLLPETGEAVPNTALFYIDAKLWVNAEIDGKTMSEYREKTL